MFGLVPFGSKKNNEVAKKEDGFNSLFDVFNDSFFANPFAGFGDMPMTANMKVDVKDNGDSYELIADLPGVDKKDIALNYDNNYLTIEAKKDESNDQKDDKGNYTSSVTPLLMTSRMRWLPASGANVKPPFFSPATCSAMFTPKESKR